MLNMAHLCQSNLQLGEMQSANMFKYIFIKTPRRFITLLLLEREMAVDADKRHEN